VAAVVAAAPAWGIGPPPLGHELPAGLRICAFGARPGGQSVLDAMKARPPSRTSPRPTWPSSTARTPTPTTTRRVPTRTTSFCDHLVPSLDKFGTHS